jgi:amidase
VTTIFLSASPSLIFKTLRRTMATNHVNERLLASATLPSLLTITIENASEGLNGGHFTSVDLVKAYMARIEEASYFRAVLQVNPDALIAAKDLDDERLRSGSRG